MTKHQTTTYFYLFLLVFLGLAFFGLATPKALAVTSGDLLKAPDSPAVYFVGEGNTKYVFPNSTTYLSWYPDYSLVQTVDTETLQSYNTVGNVVARAGTKLVQFVAFNADGTMNVDDPKVYALEPNGLKRWISSATIAEQLYGTDWETKIYGCPNYLIDNYTDGSAITTATYPEGSIVKANGSPNVYYINANGDKQLLTSDGFDDNLLQEENILTASNLDSYSEAGTAIAEQDAVLTTIVANAAPAHLPDNVYFVAPNGNDNNPGTLALPFKTISHAATIAMAGDIVYIRGGIYEETVTLPHSGTAMEMIVFTNHANESPEIKATNGYGFYLGENINHIRINGLKITRALGATVQTISAYEPYINSSIAHGAGIKLVNANFNEITNNFIYDNDIGVFISPLTEEGNASTNNYIIGNSIFDSGEAGIRIKRSDYTRVDSNHIYNNGWSTNDVYSEPAAGVVYYCTLVTKINNNRIWGNSSGAIQNYAGTGAETCDAESSVIRNNTLVQTTPQPTLNNIFDGKRYALSIADKEISDSSHAYYNNSFYNGGYSEEMVAWGVNNIGTTGELLSVGEFNNVASALNPLSGNNIELNYNPI